MFKTLSNFQKYDTINENKKIMLFSNFYLPIEIIKTTNYEYEMLKKIEQLDAALQKINDAKENIDIQLQSF